ncbi:MAG: LysR family transcriptional regulator [Coriobacteriaceae bacterium]|nr:LysR family transcriptional regulator [Coriobacteriaceae bacterium]
MNLSHLYYFRTLAEVQHYTRAAEKLFITQPTLSNAVSQLEKELGIPLFEKDGRNVRLTKQGREFNTYISQALDLVDKAIDVAHEQAGAPSGSFDLGVIYTIQADYLPRLLRGFRAKYGQNIRINTFQGLTESLVDDLVAGRYDVVFGSRIREREDLGYVPVVSQRLVALVHDYSPFAMRESVSFEELSHAKVYTYPTTTALGREVDEVLREKMPGITIYGTAEDEITLGSMVDSDSSAVGLTLETLGILPFSRLKVVPITGMPDDFHMVYLIYRKNAFQPRSVENFIQYVQEFNDGKPMVQRLHMNSLGDSRPASDRTVTPGRVLRSDALLGDELIGAPEGLAGKSVPGGHGGIRG